MNTEHLDQTAWETELQKAMNEIRRATAEERRRAGARRRPNPWIL